MTKIKLLAVGLLLGSAGSVASAQEGPCTAPRRDLVSPVVQAKVTQGADGLHYHYLVANQPDAAQFLMRFAVEAFPVAGSEPIQGSPVGWEGWGAITNSNYYSWTTLQEPRGLAPGTAIEGFQFVRAELPALVTYLAWGHAELLRFPEGQAPESCKGSNILENNFKGKTIGPKAPPQPFVPIEFLNYLITLLHDSRQQGWIRVDGVHQSLLAKLLAAKRSLEAGRNEPAKGQLNAFLNEVQAVSCPEFTCPGNKPLTSEAYALLFFNGQHLFERLPAPGRTPH